MPSFSPVRSQPIVLSSTQESHVYALFAMAMGLSFVGVMVGIAFAESLLTSGMHMLFIIAELAIIFTARWWQAKTPWNYVLFGLFPLLSGITVTPYILYVLIGYANGAPILLNALASTVFMAAAAAVFARMRLWNMAGLQGILFMSLIGLIVLGVLQIFIPALRAPGFEVLLSGAGVIVFALFTAMDMQRLQSLARAGASPFLIALNLYLDIFNLFLFVVRFMVAISGRRR